MPKRFRTHTLAVVAALVALPTATLAKGTDPDWEETDKLPAVQNRRYRMEHEFNLGIGVLPVDAFYKGLTASGGYAWHITDLWAVEGRGYYSQNFKTSLRDKLENNFGEPPSKFAQVRWYAELGLLFKPLYGKLAFLNNQQVYGEVFLSAAAVVSRMDGGKATEAEPQGQGPRMAFGGAPGFGFRGWLSERWSLRFDFRSHIVAAAGELYYPITLTLSLALSTRSDL